MRISFIHYFGLFYCKIEYTLYSVRSTRASILIKFVEQIITFKICLLVYFYTYQILLDFIGKQFLLSILVTRKRSTCLLVLLECIC